MPHGIDDTSPDAWRALLGLYRKMPPEERLRRVAALNRMTRTMALSGMRERHPDASEEEIRLRCAALWLDRDTMRRAYGWEPTE